MFMGRYYRLGAALCTALHSGRPTGGQSAASFADAEIEPIKIHIVAIPRILNVWKPCFCWLIQGFPLTLLPLKAARMIIEGA
ncbi:MAG: hypothetical protein CVU16_11990 [Betaproteobacteria bacterium HGW-Betaproteobacteria-10]|nr:MAG: hypothetical protein CVU16_11990 [Betaproteobacteria bacterium HGW-Betaproteobacteria-10]